MIFAVLGWLRSSWIGKAAVFALAALAAIAMIRRDAKRDAIRDMNQKDAENALDIHKRADRALRDADGADAAEWLRQRGKIRD